MSGHGLPHVESHLGRTGAVRILTADVGCLATMACLLEATARKPGNVHPGASFADLHYRDFVASAAAIAPAMAAACGRRLGSTVHRAVRATRISTGTNTNLGTVLLLVPLAMVPRGTEIEAGVAAVLAALDADDARQVYAAIRLACPGGLGSAEQADVLGPPPDDLVWAMRQSAGRDLVARQYANGFDDVLTFVAPAIAGQIDRGQTLEASIIHTQLSLMARTPDSLIARKCGHDVAAESAERARRALVAADQGPAAAAAELRVLDAWLRADGHRRNPGTTADMIAAGLFVLLRSWNP
jgi:triphosphoribosyl-dephospho-CoA synthase